MAIDDTRGAGYHDTGAIYDLVKPSKNAMKPAGQWNHVVITCDKSRIRIELKGEQLFYNVRSHMGPAFGFCADVRREGVDWAKFRRLADQWRRIAPCYLGDFFPLTPYSLAEDVWLAWQFDRPDLGEGMVQVFRRQANPCCAAAWRR